MDAERKLPQHAEKVGDGAEDQTDKLEQTRQIKPEQEAATHEEILPHIAAYTKDPTKLLYLIVRYPELSSLTDKDQWNAAHFAAMTGDIDFLESCIHDGIDPLSRTSTHATLLHLAANYTELKTLKYLCVRYPELIQLKDENQWNAAHFAAKGGDIDCLETLIRHGIDPMSMTSKKETLLHIAALYKQSKTLKYICKRYPKLIQLEDTNKCKAAHYAAKGGDIDCLETLIRHGIDPLSVTSTQETLLHIAARWKHLETLQYLCKKYPALIQLKDENQWNAAHYAAKGGDIDCLKTLIRHGIDPLSRTSTLETMLHVAARWKHPETLEYLCKSYPAFIQLTDENQWNATHYAAMGGDVDCLETLIRHGIDPLSRTATHETMLHVAARWKHPETLEYLCKRYPAFIQLTDKNQWNAAHYAAMGGDVDCLETLIHHGIDPLSRTSKQETLLHIAARWKHPETLEYLCKRYPAFLQLTDKNQWNAAHYAAMGGDVDCLETLIRHGIDPLSRTSTLETMLHVAARWKHQETLEYLCKRYPAFIQLTDENQWNAAHYAAMGGDVDCLETLIRHGIDPLSRTSTQETLLHIAARSKNPETLEYLCKRYPECIKLTDKNEWNAAHYAAIDGDIDCLESLIRHGIDPLSVTSTQKTLLHIAARWKHQEILQYLCKRYPALIQLKDENQWNAAHYAAMGGDVDCLETLIRHGIDPLSRTSTLETMLHVAARWKQIKMVEHLRKTYPTMAGGSGNEEAVKLKSVGRASHDKALKKTLDEGLEAGNEKVDARQNVTDTSLITSKEEENKLKDAGLKSRSGLDLMKEECDDFKQGKDPTMAGGSDNEETVKTQTAESKSSTKKTIFGKPFEHSCILDDENTPFQIPGSDVQVIFPDSLTKNNRIEVHGSTFRSITHIRKRFALPTSEAVASPVTEYHVSGCTECSDNICVKVPFVGPSSELKVWKFLSDEGITHTTTRLPVPMKGKNSNKHLFYEVEGASTCNVYTQSFSGFFCTTDGNRPLTLRALLYASHNRVQSLNQYEVRIRMCIVEDVMKFKDYIKNGHAIVMEDGWSQYGDVTLTLPQGDLSEESYIEAVLTPAEVADNQWKHILDGGQPSYPDQRRVQLRHIVQKCPESNRCHMQSNDHPYIMGWSLTNREDNVTPSRFQGAVSVTFVAQFRSTRIVIDRNLLRPEDRLPTEETVVLHLLHNIRDLVVSMADDRRQQLLNSFGEGPISLNELLNGLQLHYKLAGIIRQLVKAFTSQNLNEELEQLFNRSQIPEQYRQSAS